MSQQAGAPRQNIETQSGGGGFLGGLSNKASIPQCLASMNEFGGGGKAGEAREDTLDKGIDWVQEHVLGQGPQNNESAAEQFKDEQISDFIRGQYKGTTGSNFPVADK
ncbi:hypothetical protein BXZ70DRAFT_906038 [Cristinia sonorae]|uniref:DNA damage-responsive protein 48 n=1 Tax=Cristinia sonorae TaxID=1940300 RepID=A0A8K0XR32_9AGAR|nr:hypothetical protein BXZ70DRAFT_906038 [Cristinia sonorae]